MSPARGSICKQTSYFQSLTLNFEINVESLTDTKPTAVTEPKASLVQKSETPQVPIQAKIPVSGRVGQGKKGCGI